VKSCVIITPTTGNHHLEQCIDSVVAQTYANIRHLIVADGPQYADAVSAYTANAVVIPENVGAHGWYGHRIYAAFTYLVNEDYVIYLDEDNFIDTDHVGSMIQQIEDNEFSWTFSYRKILDETGTFICNDECESIGTFHVDTSAFCIKREIAVKVAHAWYGQYGADRHFFSMLKTYFNNFAGTGKYTLNYRCGSTVTSVKPEFFLEGNTR
jgi:glycosyltransferase involved in cell wall biosynthesis